MTGQLVQMRRNVLCAMGGLLLAMPATAQKPAEPGMAAGAEQGERAKPGRTFAYDFGSHAMTLPTIDRDGAQGCPVAMEAKRLGGGDLVRAGKSVERGPGQRIRLTLHDRTDAAKVVGARVAVRGTDGKARVTTLTGLTDFGSGRGQTSGPAEVTRVVSLRLNDRGESWAAADMLLGGLTSVSRVTLIELTYEDGTTWVRGGGSSCSVVPAPLMLVAGR